MDFGVLVLALVLTVACSPTSRAGRTRPTAGPVQQRANRPAPGDATPQASASSPEARQQTPPCIERQSATQFCMLYVRKGCTDPSGLFAEMSARFEDVHKSRCNDTTVISYSDPLGAMEFFFDDAHGLVAARHRGDTNSHCKHSSFTAWFGASLPECTNLPEFTAGDFKALLPPAARELP